MPKTKFIKIRCSRCKNDQVTYGKATLKIKCLKCNKLLIKPRGGKAKVRAAITEIL